VRVQARRGRAPAVGLRGREPGRPGGRGVRGVPRGGLEHRAAHGHAGRAVRPRHVPALDRSRSRRRPHRARPPHRPRRTARHGGVRRGGEQRRPQDRPPAAGSRRPPLRLRPRRMLRRGIQAAHRPVAVARQDPAEAVGRGAAPPAHRAGRGRAGRRARQVADRQRARRHQAADRAAPQKPHPPLPPGGLARRPLAPRVNPRSLLRGRGVEGGSSPQGQQSRPRGWRPAASTR
jgi:hypothetical protein